MLIEILLLSLLLGLDKIIHPQLGPHKVHLRRYLVHQLPPKPPPHDPLNNRRVVPLSNKELIRLLDVVREMHI